LQTPVGKEGVNSPMGKEGVNSSVGVNSLAGKDGMNSAVGARNKNGTLKILHQGQESMFRGEKLEAFEGLRLGRASWMRAGADVCGKGVGEDGKQKSNGI
jgi:hypothetical protein